MHYAQDTREPNTHKEVACSGRCLLHPAHFKSAAVDLKCAQAFISIVWGWCDSKSIGNSKTIRRANWLVKYVWRMWKMDDYRELFALILQTCKP